MTENHTTLRTKFIVCHNGIDVYHYIESSSSNTFTTGLPYTVVFDTKEEALAEFGDKISLEEYIPRSEQYRTL